MLTNRFWDLEQAKDVPEQIKESKFKKIPKYTRNPEV